MIAIEGFTVQGAAEELGVLVAQALVEHGLRHGFATRLLGEGRAPWTSSTFGSASEEPSGDVRENIARIGARFEFAPERLFRVRQIHSDRLVVVEPGSDAEEIAAVEADALVTAAPGHFLSVQTADCVPVLLFDPRRKVVAAAHCGWRGLVRGVLERTVGVMSNFYGGRPVDFVAAIGPSIGACCYEVDAEVAKRFARLEAVVPPQPGKKPTVDLRGAAARILVGLGVSPEGIARCELCTRCRPDLFFSHRGQGAGTGRHLNFIGLGE